ncbi:hypothetical protein [Aquibacillus albus]|uniref:Uncharacterized protein n=1 Tax=Aquibacillus albus TaxID=1168171 RepID=A0ABS2MZA1_9BACI|nr:hypothetical protein [Aquibacillus albus]MBM7571211.1 hypothetical protein [Aquibacillus albus]
MKQRYLWIGMALIMISWVGNYLYFQSKQLAAPIFLDHYYEAYGEDEVQLTFYYLTNKKNPADVSYVRIDDVEGYPHQPAGNWIWQDNQNQVQYEQAFRHHYLRSVTIRFNLRMSELFADGKESYAFKEMDVFFQDQTDITADIGEVIIYKNRNDDPIFDNPVSSGSNQHRAQKSIVARQPVTIEEMDVPFEEVANDVSMKVHLQRPRPDGITTEGSSPDWVQGKDNDDWERLPGDDIVEGLFPIYIEESDRIRLYLAFNPNRTSYFDFSIHIKGKTGDGQDFIYQTPFIDSPYLTQESVDQIIGKVEGGEVE